MVTIYLDLEIQNTPVSKTISRIIINSQKGQNFEKSLHLRDTGAKQARAIEALFFSNCKPFMQT